MLHVASLRKRGTMGQVVHSATGSVGDSAELARLRGELRKLRKERASVREADRMELLSQIEDTKKQAEHSSALVSSYEARIKELELDNRRLEEENGRSGRALAKRQSLASKVREITEKMDAEKRKNTRLKRKLAQLRVSYADNANKAEKAEKAEQAALDINEDKVKKLTEERNAVQSNLLAVNQKVADLEKQLNGIKVSGVDKDHRIAELTEALERERVKIATLEERLSNLNNEMDSIKEETKKERALLLETQSGLNNEKEELTQQLAHANATIQQKATEIKQSEDKARSLEQKANEVREALSELTKENERLTSLLEAPNKKEGISEERIRQVESQIKERGDKIRLLEQKLSEYETSMKSLTEVQSKDFEDLSSTITNITKVLQEATDSKSAIYRRLAGSERDAAAIKSELTGARKKARGLTSQVRELEDKRRKLEADVVKYKGELERSASKGIETVALISNKDAQIKELDLHLTSKTSELSKMSEILETKERELAENNRSLRDLEESLSREKAETKNLRWTVDELKVLMQSQETLQGTLQKAIQNKINEAERALSEQSHLNQGLTKQVRDANVLINILDQEASRLKETLSKVKSELQCADQNDIVGCIKGKITERERLAERLKECRNINEKHASETEALKAQIQELTDTRNANTEELLVLQKKIKHLERIRAEIAGLIESVNMLDTETTKIKEHIKEAQTKEDEYVSRMKELNMTIASQAGLLDTKRKSDNDARVMKMKLDENVKKRISLSRKLESLRKELADNMKELNDNRRAASERLHTERMRQERIMKVRRQEDKKRRAELKKRLQGKRKEIERAHESEKAGLYADLLKIEAELVIITEQQREQAQESEKQMKARENETKSLNELIESLTRGNSDLKKRKETSDAEISSLASAYADEKLKAKAELASLASQLQKCNTDKESLSAELKDTNAKSASDAQNYQEQKNELERRRIEIMEKLRAESESSAGLGRAIEEKTAEITSLRADIKILRSEKDAEIEIKDSQISQLTRAKVELDVQINKLSEEHRRLLARIKEQDAQIAALQNELKTKKTENELLQSQVVSLTKEVEESRAQSKLAEEQSRECNSKLQECEQRRASLESQIAETTRQISTKTSEAGSMKQTIEGLNGKIAAFESTIRENEDKITTLVTTNKTDASKAREEITAQRKELDRVIAEKAAVTSKYDLLELELRDLRASNDALHLKNAEATRELASAKEKQNALENERGKISDILSGEIVGGDELTGVAAELNTIRNEISDLCPRPSNLVECAKALRKNLDDTKTQLVNTEATNMTHRIAEKAKIQIISGTIGCTADDDPYKCIGEYIQKSKLIIDGARELGYSTDEDVLSSIGSKKELDDLKNTNTDLTKTHKDMTAQVNEQNLRIEATQTALIKALNEANAKADQVEKTTAENVTLKKRLEDALSDLEVNIKEASKLDDEKTALLTANSRLTETNRKLDDALRAQQEALASYESAKNDLRECESNLARARSLYTETQQSNETMAQEIAEMQATVDLARNTRADLLKAKANVITCTIESLECMLGKYANDLDSVIRRVIAGSVEQYGNGMRMRPELHQEVHVFDIFVVPLIAKYRKLHAIKSENTRSTPSDEKKAASSKRIPAQSSGAFFQPVQPVQLKITKGKQQTSSLDSKSAPSVRGGGKHAEPLPSAKSGAPGPKAAAATSARAKGQSQEGISQGRKLASESLAGVGAEKHEKQDAPSVSSPSAHHDTDIAVPKAKGQLEQRVPTPPSPEDTKYINNFLRTLIHDTSIDSIYTNSDEIQTKVHTIREKITRLIDRVSGNQAKSIQEIANRIKDTTKLYILSGIQALFDITDNSKHRKQRPLELLEMKEIKDLVASLTVQQEKLANEADALRKITIDPDDERNLNEIMELDIDVSSGEPTEPTGVDENEIHELRSILDIIDKEQESSAYKRALYYLLLLTRVTIDVASQRNNDRINYTDAVLAVQQVFDDTSSHMNTETDKYPDTQFSEEARRIIAGIRAEVSKAEKSETNERIVLQRDILDRIDTAESHSTDAQQDKETNTDKVDNNVEGVASSHLLQFLLRQRNKDPSRSNTPLPNFGKRGPSTHTTTSRLGSFV